MPPTTWTSAPPTHSNWIPASPRKAATTALAEGGSCCGGKPCGGGGSDCCDDDPKVSRYPKQPPAVDPSVWARAAGGAADQFCGYARGLPDASPEPFTYAGPQLAAFAFPLGGFGAGHVCLRGDGTLQKWCVLNQIRQEAQPLDCMPACFFGLSVGGQSYALASPETYSEERCGLPAGKPARVEEASVSRLKAIPGVRALSVVARYPVADVSYDIAGCPVEVSMRALSPMVPLDAKSSALPCALFQFNVKNTSLTEQTVRLLQSQTNFVGWDGQADCTQPPTPFWGGNVNSPLPSGAGADGGGAGLSMTNGSVKPTDARAGSLVVATLPPTLPSSSSVASSSSAGGGATAWAASLISGEADEASLWSAFVSEKDVPAAQAKPTAASAAGSTWCGGVVQTATLAPGEEATLGFSLSWCFANRTKQYSGIGAAWDKALPNGDLLGNQYQNWFADAAAAAAYLRANLPYLVDTTAAYVETMYGSTLPWQLVDSAAGRAAVLRSPTMWWTADGTVMGCEGNGCCPLNCSHVYGYTTLIERLYPSLAQNMRLSDFVRNFDPTLGVTMRFGATGALNMRYAIDGALASVIKAYLAVQQSDADLSFLKQIWPNVKAQMALVRKDADTGDDGVIRNAQQNTYDTAMYGANTFIGTYYVTALRAAAKMATLMGEAALSQQYAQRASLAAASYDKICWNDGYGYYVADVTLQNCKYSYGPGCFVDQLCAAGLSLACGLGSCFDGTHEASARKAIARYNVVKKPPWHDLQKHLFDGDTGVTVCTYPHGKLGDGMMYDTLVSTGFTSPVIAGLLYDRNLADAERLNGYIRQRHDGRNRSPWNEPECNLLYSRAMAHWNIFDQACGLKYDCTAQHLAFDPRYRATDFKCFFVGDGGWGQFAQKGSAGLASGTASLEMQFGSVKLSSLGLATSATAATAAVDGKSVTVASLSAGVVTFAAPLTLAAGSTLTVALGGGAVSLEVLEGGDGKKPPADGLRRRRAGAGDEEPGASKGGGAEAAGWDGSAMAPTLASWRQVALLGAVGVALFLLGALCGVSLER